MLNKELWVLVQYAHPRRIDLLKYRFDHLEQDADRIS